VSATLLGGRFIIVANTALGASVVFYNSYLPLMVDDAEEVRAAAAAGEDAARAAQEKVISEYSSKVGAVQVEHSVDPWLESNWFQPLHR
jgi:hypothetical protein